MGDETDDTLTIAVEAARDAIDSRRSAPGTKVSSPPSGPWALLSGMDKGTLTLLAAFIGVLTMEADRWVASMVRDEDTAISRAVTDVAEKAALSECRAEVDALRGEVHQAAEKPPTISDITEKAWEDRQRIYALERILDVGEARRRRIRDEESP
ncbi:MAG: hypothetical protein CMH39_00385 [Micrococcales bacterium]|jgi:hypothetical protein|nr:hypothetical protein [Micrococcales bacterium]